MLVEDDSEPRLAGLAHHPVKPFQPGGVEPVRFVHMPKGEEVDPDEIEAAAADLGEMAHLEAGVGQAHPIGIVAEHVDSAAELHRQRGWARLGLDSPRSAGAQQERNRQNPSFRHHPSLRFERRPRRQQHLDARASTLVRFDPAGPGDEAGLAALQSDEYWYSVALAWRAGGRVVELKRRAGPGDPAEGIVLVSAPAPGGPLRLRIDAKGGRYDFAYAGPSGPWRTRRAGEDGTLLSTRTAGGFVGAVFGPYARSANRAD